MLINPISLFNKYIQIWFVGSLGGPEKGGFHPRTLFWDRSWPALFTVSRMDDISCLHPPTQYGARPTNILPPLQIQPKSRKKMGLCPKMGVAQGDVIVPGKMMISYGTLVSSDKPMYGWWEVFQPPITKVNQKGDMTVFPISCHGFV